MQTMTQVRKCWSSGFVNRWHTNTDPRLRNAQDTNDAHSNRVAKLVYMFSVAANVHLDETDLGRALEEAIWHDAPEKLTGDVGYETKRLHPEMRVVLRKLDTFYWQQVGVEPMWYEPIDALVALCDQIDALLFCRLMAPDLWEREDWQNHATWVFSVADALGIGPHVRELTLHWESGL